MLCYRVARYYTLCYRTARYYTLCYRAARYYTLCYRTARYYTISLVQRYSLWQRNRRVLDRWSTYICHTLPLPCLVTMVTNI